MSLLDDLLSYPAYAVIRLRDDDAVQVLAGPRTDLERLADAPLEPGSGSGGAHLRHVAGGALPAGA